MRTRLVLAGLVLLLAACGGDTPEGSIGDEAEVEAIRECDAAYKAALLDGDGETASELVTASTIAYYQKMIDLALSASAEETRALPLLDKISVLIARASIEADRLRAMDGKAFFVHAVDTGMIGKNSVIRAQLGQVVVSGDHATGEHIVAGEPTGIHWRFRRENGDWHKDVMSIAPVATAGFQKLIQDSGMSEDEFLLSTIAVLTGTKPGDEVWQPVSR